MKEKQKSNMLNVQFEQKAQSNLNKVIKYQARDYRRGVAAKQK